MNLNPWLRQIGHNPYKMNVFQLLGMTKSETNIERIGIIIVNSPHLDANVVDKLRDPNLRYHEELLEHDCHKINRKSLNEHIKAFGEISINADELKPEYLAIENYSRLIILPEKKADPGHGKKRKMEFSPLKKNSEEGITDGIFLDI
jgi:hypothetical protein